MYNYDNPRYRGKVWENVKWGAVVVFILSLVAGCSSTGENSTNAPVEDTIKYQPIKERYTLLRNAEMGTFKNLNILIDSAALDNDDIVMAALMSKASECRDLPCNAITIWSSKKALELYEDKEDGAAWRRKYWPYICEHYIGEYNATVGELNTYPFIDSEYKRWGGKKKRPEPNSFDI